MGIYTDADWSDYGGGGPSVVDANWPTTSRYRYYVTAITLDNLWAPLSMHLPLTRIKQGKNTTYKVAILIPRYGRSKPKKLNYTVLFETGPSGKPKTVAKDDFTVLWYEESSTRFKRC